MPAVAGRPEHGVQEAILAASPLPITTRDLDGRLTSFNPAAARLFGWDESVLGTRPEPDPEVIDDLLARVTASGTVQQAEFHQLSRSGELHTLTANAALLRCPQGEPTGVVIVGMDVTEERRQRGRLREAMELFESAFLHGPEGIGLVSIEPDPADRRWLKVNPALCRMLEYGEAELLRIPPVSLIHPDDRDAVLNDTKGLMAGDQPAYHRLRRMLRKDGSTLWAIGNASLVHDEAGEPVYIVAQYTDTSEVHLANEALAASEHNFRMLAETTSDVIVRAASDGERLYVSPATRRMLGYDPDEYARIVPETGIHPDDRDAVQRAIETVARGERTTVEYRFRHKYGYWVWIEATVAGVYAGDGGLLERISVLRSVDDRKQAETDLRSLAASLEQSNRDLRELGDRLQQKFEHSPVAEAVVSLNGHFLDVNPAEERLLGRSRAELLGMTTDEVTHQDDIGIVEALEATFAIEEPSTFEIEIRRIHADGHEIPVLTTASLLHDADGNPSAYIVQSIDLTERKRIEREQRALEASLHESQRLESLGILAGGIAHDFNNLLQAVLLSTDVLMRRLASEDDRAVVVQIRNAGRRAAELSREMLAYSGKGTFVVAPVSLNDVIADLTELMRTAIPKKASLRTDLDPDLPAFLGDSAQLHQIVLNLITNAAEALDDGEGTITIRTGAVEADAAYLKPFELDPLAPGRYVYVEVGDTGCGIEDAALARIFDPFFTTKFTGRGLGLAAVLGIVRGHGGGIKVYSEAGRGTTFKLVFPAGAEVAAEDAAAVQPIAGGRRGRLLVADDEEAVRSTVALLLRDLGYTVVAVENGIAAVEAFSREAAAFDAAILDLTMPGLSGDEAAAGIRAIDPHAPVVIMSGFSAVVMGSKLVDTGEATLLEKPFTLGELLAAIDGARARAEAPPA